MHSPFISFTQQGSIAHNNNIYFSRNRLIFGGCYVHSEVIASGFPTHSDGRIKTQEKVIESATESLGKVVAKSYMKHPSHRVDYDDESPVDLDASGNKIPQKFEYGVVAQELELIEELKHMVVIPDNDTQPDTKSVDYTQFIALLIRSNQELGTRRHGRR